MADPVTEVVTHTGEMMAQGGAALRMRRGLLWVLAGTAAVFVYVVYANWFLVGYPHVARWQAWLQQRAQQRQFARLLAQDPPLGARLSSVVRNNKEAGRKEGTSRAQIVVFGGPLTSCCTGRAVETARGLVADVQRKPVTQSVEVVLVLQSSAPAAQEYAASQRLNFAVTADKDGSLMRAYNAFWTPRAYGLVEGQLRWIQKGQRLDAQEIMQALSKGKSVSRRPAPFS